MSPEVFEEAGGPDAATAGLGEKIPFFVVVLLLCLPVAGDESKDEKVPVEIIKDASVWRGRGIGGCM